MTGHTSMRVNFSSEDAADAAVPNLPGHARVVMGHTRFHQSSLISTLVMLLLMTLVASRTHTQLRAAQITADGQAAVRRQLAGVEAELEVARGTGRAASDHLADAALFTKAVEWALRYEPNITPADLALIHHALDRGQQRAAALAAGSMPWVQKRGRLVRGYVSAVDGSVQPYGLVIPAGYDKAKPIRLDVVLHGSVRPDGLASLHFLMPFDQGDNDDDAPRTDYIELYPLGRVENCYRWAGESDVFEAIEDVCRHYNINRERVVLRGMSMGASGTWHLGLKHPDRFIALGPYCGYVDTHRFSETPGMNFLKVGPLPDYQEKMLHMLDSVDYAANAGVVPAIAAIGDRDPFFQAHVIMGEAMRREGLQMVNLISPGTAHVQDPTTWAEQMRRIGAYADRGLGRVPRHIRFITWTLKYARCHWIELLSLGEHYRRSEMDATVADNGDIAVKEPVNVTRFAIFPPMLPADGSRLTVGDQTLRLPARPDLSHSPDSGRQPSFARRADSPEIAGRGAHTPGIIVERHGGRWRFGGYTDTVRVNGKRPGLQGPIDDAFTTRFLCVRGTGKPWNPAVQAWANANLSRFAYEWSRYFLGDLPVKDDTAVTAADCRDCNLILFGDPGSNIWIRKALQSLPIHWTRDMCAIGKQRFMGVDFAPAGIFPSPFTGAGQPAHYLVVNSGHTFHEAELGRLNYLLFPRLADWAIFKVGDKQPSTPTAPLTETLLNTGFWDENWK